METVRYGMIGFGGIAENRLAKEGFGLDRARFAAGPAAARLLAASDVNPARRPAVEALGLAWAASADEMLARADIDAVVVATNNLTHAALARRALAAGKHVFVEKPMATTSADARGLLALAREKGLSLAVDHMMTHNAWNRAARDLVRGGTLGTVNDAVFHMEFGYGFEPAEAASWRCANTDELGGPIGDVASHCFYMAEFMFDAAIARVAAVYLPKTMSIAAEDGAYVKYELSDGRRGSIKAAFSEPRGGLGGTLSNLGYEIYGDRGVLRAHGTLFQLSGHPGEPVPQRLELDHFTSRSEITPKDIANIYQGVIARQAESILSGQPWLADDAARNVALCEAAHASARAGGVWKDI